MEIFWLGLRCQKALLLWCLCFGESYEGASGVNAQLTVAVIGTGMRSSLCNDTVLLPWIGWPSLAPPKPVMTILGEPALRPATARLFSVASTVVTMGRKTRS